MDRMWRREQRQWWSGQLRPYSDKKVHCRRHHIDSRYEPYSSGSVVSALDGTEAFGTPAQFSVTSDSLILTHVPSGATTGKIEVTLPGQTLSSDVPFYVLK
ncbi:MAG TPA: hypothetical protein VK763_11060 [Terriglobales bacterium]|nr:hypothetical protein [Terriglobales bacterium]